MVEEITVTFNSDTSNYYKEFSGKKRNTVRKIDATDIRFLGFPTNICIKHKQIPKEYFIKKITDITDYEVFRIFSW